MFLSARSVARGTRHAAKLARSGGPAGGARVLLLRVGNRQLSVILRVGGGPAGLYLSILLKRQDPSHDVTVYERDPEGSTYGWGVTYWRHLLDRLHEQDPESAGVLDADSVRWSAGVAHVRGLTTRHSGDQGHGIGRHRLLEILAARARDLGVRLEYEREITAGDLPSGTDLIVAADGVRSALRTRHATHFGSRLTPGAARYLLARHVLGDITLKAVADRAGVSPPLILKYFGNKDTLFARVMSFETDADALLAAPLEDLGPHMVRHVLVSQSEQGDILRAELAVATLLGLGVMYGIARGAELRAHAVEALVDRYAPTVQAYLVP